MGSTILHIELAVPPLTEGDRLGGNSWLLRAAASFPDRLVLAFGAPGTKKDDSLGRLFSDLQPIDGEYFEIELAAILHERLPCPADALEYVVEVSDTSAIGGIYCLSNVMNIIRYRKGDRDRHTICPAGATTKFVEEHIDECGDSPHIEFVPSVVTARYKLPGVDAEEALSEGLESAVDDFIGGINKVVAAHLVSIDPQTLGILTPVYDRGSFSWIYMLIRGADDGVGAERIATSLLRTTLVPKRYDEERWNQFLAVARGEHDLDLAYKAVRTAESYIQAGSFEYALLLCAVAVEIGTTRFVLERLQGAGVSKTKLASVENDLTFNLMLNTQVVALSPAENKPDMGMIGEIDRIRRLRNDFMHRGEFNISRTEIVRLTKVAEEYLDYLIEVARETA